MHFFLWKIIHHPPGEILYVDLAHKIDIRRPLSHLKIKLVKGSGGGWGVEVVCKVEVYAALWLSCGCDKNEFDTKGQVLFCRPRMAPFVTSFLHTMSRFSLLIRSIKLAC